MGHSGGMKYTISLITGGAGPRGTGEGEGRRGVSCVLPPVGRCVQGLSRKHGGGGRGG